MHVESVLPVPQVRSWLNWWHNRPIGNDSRKASDRKFCCCSNDFLRCQIGNDSVNKGTELGAAPTADQGPDSGYVWSIKDIAQAALDGLPVGIFQNTEVVLQIRVLIDPHEGHKLEAGPRLFNPRHTFELFAHSQHKFREFGVAAKFRPHVDERQAYIMVRGSTQCDRVASNLQARKDDRRDNTDAADDLKYILHRHGRAFSMTWVAVTKLGDPFQ